MTEYSVFNERDRKDSTTLASLEPQVLHVAILGNTEEYSSSCPCVQYGCSRDCSCNSYACPCVNYGCLRDYIR
jgi:hypothetical protein